MIRQGRVSVNGHVVTELGTKADPDTANIRIDGRPLHQQRTRTIMLNKPSGYITTTSDERDRWTVMDLINVRERVYPVGRLDRDTEGLLLFTNDGELANRIMHPRYGLAKEYHIITPSRPNDRTMQRVLGGVLVDDVLIVPDEFRLLRETREGVVLKMVLHVGAQHVVRRMMESVRIPVERLRRVRVGPVTVEGVSKGQWRDLSPGEEEQLRDAVKRQQPATGAGRRREAPAATPRTRRGTPPPVAPKISNLEPGVALPAKPEPVTAPPEQAAARPEPAKRRRRGEPPAPGPARRRQHSVPAGPRRRRGSRDGGDDTRAQREKQAHGRRTSGSSQGGQHRRARRGRKDDGRTSSR